MTTITELHKNAHGKDRRHYYRRLPDVVAKKKTYNYDYKRDKENHEKHLSYMEDYNKRTKERRYELLLSKVQCEHCKATVCRGYMNRHLKTKLCAKRRNVIKENILKTATTN